MTSSLVIIKKRDIAIMRSLGSIPRKLYSFYLTEAYISFLIGFLLGMSSGVLSFTIFNVIMKSFGFQAYFYLDFFFTPILFFGCIFGIFIVSGALLRKLGNVPVIQSFSKDIPYNYDASKITQIPRWMSRFGYNFKISLINTTRRSSEYKRYFLIFLFISLIIFTLGLGTLVLNHSAQNWVHKSQGDDILVIGHHNLVNNYSKMYEIFSNPSLKIDDQVNYLKSEYIFNFSEIQELNNFSQIKQIDERLVLFTNYKELDGYFYFEEGGYQIVGQQREGIFPIVGFNISDIIQEYELEGEYFNPLNSYDMMLIGDGLAYNFFDYPFDQSTRIEQLKHSFHISGVLIDTFYSGYSGYVDLDIMRQDLNFTSEEVNVVLLKLKSGTYDLIKSDLNDYISISLGSNFTSLLLTDSFQKNLEFIENLSMIPSFLIIILAIISLLSLYNYQKSGILDKAKDFLIMRSLGTKYQNLKRILFLEATYVIIPSLFLSLGIGMILNSIVIFQRVSLPDISVPFSLIAIIMVLFLTFNYLSLYPLMKKVKKFSIKDFEIY